MKNKFNAKKVIIDGIKFDSIKEGNFYKKLLLLKNATDVNGRVKNFEIQKRFYVIINGKKICYYKLDFMVTYENNIIKYYDVKGCKKGAAYNLFKLKKKLVEALYNIEIIEK